MGRLVYTAAGGQPKRCVPAYITVNWFFNRRPRGRTRG